MAEYQYFLDEFFALQAQYNDLGDAADALKVFIILCRCKSLLTVIQAQDPTTRAESRYAELTEKWDELQATLDRMKKRIQRGYTPDADVLRAKAYIGELRGPKFVAPDYQKSVTDPAMDAYVIRVSKCYEAHKKTLQV